MPSRPWPVEPFREFDHIAKRDPVLTEILAFGVQPLEADHVLKPANVVGRHAVTPLLIKPKRVGVVVRGAEPDSRNTRSDGATLRHGQQRSADAAALLRGLDRQHFVRLRFFAYGDKAGWTPSRRRDQREMVAQVVQPAGACHLNAPNFLDDARDPCPVRLASWCDRYVAHVATRPHGMGASAFSQRRLTLAAQLRVAKTAPRHGGAQPVPLAALARRPRLAGDERFAHVLQLRRPQRQTRAFDDLDPQ